MSFKFCSKEPSLEECWRGIVQFGSNAATYKFALAKSLLELTDSGSDFIPLEELAEPYSQHIVEHVKGGRKQVTSSSSRFIDACKKFNSKEYSHDKLIGTTISLGFANVIDAFHIVNKEEISKRFFIDERTGSPKGIRLTENLFKLRELVSSENLKPEAEARWRLVETAWDLNISVRLLSVKHDLDDEQLYFSNENRRVDVTKSRPALNAYQKGRCFYCSQYISLTPKSPFLAHVDHFFPHVLKQHGIQYNVDGIWNLVLSCAACNGMAEKGSKIPPTTLLEKLYERNEFLMESNLPLRETITLQTGKNASQRRTFLQNVYNDAKAKLLHTWEPLIKADPTFFTMSNSEDICPFCTLAPNGILESDEQALAFRDGYPVTKLHTLVVPRRHVATYFDLTDQERQSIHKLLESQQDEILKEDNNVKGFNIGWNCGEVAGQTVFHAHVHLIPRRKNDVENPRGGVRNIIPGKGNYDAC